MINKGSNIADEIIRDYKREQYFKKKAEEKKDKEKKVEQNIIK